MLFSDPLPTGRKALCKPKTKPISQVLWLPLIELVIEISLGELPGRNKNCKNYYIKKKNSVWNRNDFTGYISSIIKLKILKKLID